MFDDDQLIRNTLSRAFEYDMPNERFKRKILQFEVRHWITNTEGEIGMPSMENSRKNIDYYGDVFYGTNGYMAMASADVGGMHRSWIGHDVKPGPHNEPVNGFLANLTNSLDIIRSRKMENLNPTIMEAHIPCVLLTLLRNFCPSRLRRRKSSRRPAMLLTAV